MVSQDEPEGGAELRFTGLAQLKTEGRPTGFDSAREGDDDERAAAEPDVFEGPEYRVSIYDDRITLSSGAEFYANCGIVGIWPDGDVSEGSDGGVDASKFTPEQRRELAAYMISLWTRFAE